MMIINYTVAVDETDYCYILAYADLSTGEINVMNVEKDISSLISELDNILTHEIVVKSTFNKEAITTITSKRKILISYEDNDEITLEFEGVLQEVKDLYQMRAIMRLINYFRKHKKDL